MFIVPCIGQISPGLDRGSENGHHRSFALFAIEETLLTNSLDVSDEVLYQS